MRRELTMGDLCELTGYSRFQMRGLLQEVPRFASREAKARVAKVYSNRDVLLIAVLCQLETHIGLRRQVVVELCEPIAAILFAPRAPSPHAKLVIDVQARVCQYVDGAAPVESGLVLALGQVFTTVDAYIAPARLVQAEVAFTSVAPSTGLVRGRTQRIANQRARTVLKERRQ